MTLRLILMRHAKSDWQSPAADDFERPLNKRGLDAANRVGRWLCAQGYIPELVLCSAAHRTRQTCTVVLDQLDAAPRVTFSDRLYLASPETMFQIVGQAGITTPVLMLGHNPGTALLARALARKAPPHPRFVDYPTAATTVLDFATDNWSSLTAGTGEVVDFVVPRDLG